VLNPFADFAAIANRERAHLPPRGGAFTVVDEWTQLYNAR